MRPSESSARSWFAAARVARLATAGADHRPHVVPVVFAVVGDAVITAVDAKPKTTMRLRRLVNIEANPAVSLLVDHYDEDWTRLWWVRADGRARVSRDTDVEPLVAKYPQYAAVPPTGPFVVVTVGRLTAWSATAG